MRAYVSQIRPAASGFGMFERGEAVRADGDWQTVDEFAAHVVAENPLVMGYATDPDEAESGDEWGELLACKLREVTGAVSGGHGTLVAYWMGGGEVLVESVELAETYYLSPKAWRQDEYRDIVTEEHVRQMFGAYKDAGMENEWETWEDARDECDELDAATLEAARREAWDLAGDDLNPEDRTAEDAEYHDCDGGEDGEFGDLLDYNTGARYGSATKEQRDASLEAAKYDGGAGVILVDAKGNVIEPQDCAADESIRCYVSE